MMKHVSEYRNGDISRKLVERIAAAAQSDIRIMEVCGTHTVSVFRHGIRTVLPKTVSLISGPGCPVCVTSQGDIDAMIALARLPDTIVATFGDMVRVPGTEASLRSEQALGQDVRIVYSTMDALDIARANPEKQVVFPGIGFETTAPTIAASILAAKDAGIVNYSVYSAHKRVPPALDALMALEGARIDAFLLPGHVSTVIGVKAYGPFFETHGIPVVIAGFEPADILRGILRLVEMRRDGAPALENAYARIVSQDGNPRAEAVMNRVFENGEAAWRGLGWIPGSGLAIRREFADYDAAARFDIHAPDAPPPKGCACGEILTGKLTPPQCPLYKNVCTPIDPVGPCMVSGEGSCAAYYKYDDFECVL